MKTKIMNRENYVRVQSPLNDRYALFSPDFEHRYLLKMRIPSITRWRKAAVFIMLNPSTADEIKNDPTVSRCISFAKREGCNSLTVVNLFGLRSTDPKNLSKHKDPIGPLNDRFIEEAVMSIANDYGIIVAAWGANPIAKQRGKEILSKFGPMLCLGTTKNGSPRHPLYVKSNELLKDIK